MQLQTHLRKSSHKLSFTTLNPSHHKRGKLKYETISNISEREQNSTEMLS